MVLRGYDELFSRLNPGAESIDDYSPTGLVKMTGGGMDVAATGKAMSDFATQYQRNPAGNVFSGPTMMSSEDHKMNVSALTPGDAARKHARRMAPKEDNEPLPQVHPAKAMALGVGHAITGLYDRSNADAANSATVPPPQSSIPENEQTLRAPIEQRMQNFFETGAEDSSPAKPVQVPSSTDIWAQDEPSLLQSSSEDQKTDIQPLAGAFGTGNPFDAAKKIANSFGTSSTPAPSGVPKFKTPSATPPPATTQPDAGDAPAVGGNRVSYNYFSDRSGNAGQTSSSDVYSRGSGVAYAPDSSTNSNSDFRRQDYIAALQGNPNGLASTDPRVQRARDKDAAAEQARVASDAAARQAAWMQSQQAQQALIDAFNRSKAFAATPPPSSGDYSYGDRPAQNFTPAPTPAPAPVASTDNSSASNAYVPAPAFTSNPIAPDNSLVHPTSSNLIPNQFYTPDTRLSNQSMNAGPSSSVRLPSRYTWKQASDERKKKDVKETSSDNALDEFMGALKAYQYKYKDPNEPGASPGQKVGVMAQDLEKSRVGKDAVLNTPTGKMVDYGKLIPVTIAELVVGREEREQLKKQLDGIEAVLEELQKRG